MASKKTKSSLSSTTLNSLAAALEQETQKKLAKRPPNSFTLSEYREATGLAKTTAVERISTLRKVGRLKDVRIPVLNAIGALRYIPGYQIVDTTPA